MSFTSLQFLFFFPTVTALYFLLPYRWRWLLLLVASCLFYMAFVPEYILILAFTIVVDYFAGIAIEGATGSRRRLFLIVSLIANIGVLAFFKYYNFTAENLNGLVQLLGGRRGLPFLGIILPIGLSFHTFQAMSYTIEVYRKNQKAERHFGIYALYVMFYPQLTAGPIERPQNLLHQFHAEHAFDYDDVTEGLKQMSWGFFKKTVVADRMTIGVDVVYANPRAYSGVQLTLAAIMFAVQAYADFSGYSDIAIGSARVMGIRLMRNFNRPYEAKTLPDFWRRWHISLYSWFNDYLYTEFVFAIRDWGKTAVILGVLLTFTVSGLWHGAAWKFVIWGSIHGVALAIEMLTRKIRKRLFRARAWDYVAHVVTLAIIWGSFIFFRAKSVADAWYVLTHLGSGWGRLFHTAGSSGVISETLGAMGYFRQELIIGAVAVAAMFGLEALNARYDLYGRLKGKPVPVRWGAYYLLVGAVVFFGAYNSTQPFIYFQF